MEKGKILEFWRKFTSGKYMDQKVFNKLSVFYDRVSEDKDFMVRKHIAPYLETFMHNPDEEVEPFEQIKRISALIHHYIYARHIPFYANISMSVQIGKIIMEVIPPNTYGIDRKAVERLDLDKDSLNVLGHSMEVLTNLPYLQFVKNKETQYAPTSLFFVSDKVKKSFEDTEFPDDLPLNEIISDLELPATFIFENEEVWQLLEEENKEKGYYNFNRYFIDNKVVKYDTVMRPNDSIIPKDGNLIYYSGLEEYGNPTEIVKTLLNLILFVQAKNIDADLEEFNQDRIAWEKRIAIKKQNNARTDKDERALNGIPSYKIINLDLTLEKYDKTYYKKNNIDTSDFETVIKWRRAHWHKYWKGTGENKHVIVHRIPRIPVRYKVLNENTKAENIYQFRNNL